MRSMMVRRRSDSVETSVVGMEASKMLSAIRGISEVQVVSQQIDRATLTFNWTPEARKFDSRLDFGELDKNLQSKDMHRMQ